MSCTHVAGALDALADLALLRRRDAGDARGQDLAVVRKEVPFCQSSFCLRLQLKSASRKEVFQPHLPVRLPCYDLAPVTTFTLGSA